MPPPPASSGFKFRKTKNTGIADSLTTNWIDSAATEIVSTINSTWERVVVEDEVDITNATNRFGRVIVIQD